MPFEQLHRTFEGILHKEWDAAENSELNDFCFNEMLTRWQYWKLALLGIQKFITTRNRFDFIESRFFWAF